MNKIARILIMVCLIAPAFAKTFSRCELVDELKRQGFPDYLMKDLVCLVGEASSFRTHVTGGPDPDGSYDYGLFQINSRYWCSSGPTPGNTCNVRCADLLSDDISLSSACAKKILSMRGLSAWVSWEQFCRGRYIPELDC
ncbi:lysozyme-like [Anticarsia gemmatalis]|uniref:lysozyme-like n=1 Tax=Anticarsia gemmatalis TaxID=129554 RepID=UPI003F76C021